MNKPRIVILIMTLYCIGNNQIAYASDGGSMSSQSSITFDKTYIPTEDFVEYEEPLIPNGGAAFPVYTGKSTLPKTGETGSQSGQLLGITLLSTSLLLSGLNKTKKENIKN
ncbi:LPXTG cell wall anchor domain-containing protein [Lactococcus petauri]|uniref:LPXTG cell wall anchor domain-containing protein n=1 Tax=Lactococcus petauri TaxID=1940789 RepID=UPI003852F54F